MKTTTNYFSSAAMLTKLLFGAAAITITMALLLPAQAWAHGRVHLGFMFGGPWWPFYDPYPVQTVVVERQVPMVYIEQGQNGAVLANPAAATTNSPAVSAAAGAPPADNFWYYCAAAKGYYPYVKSCPAGWKRVAPTPPDLK